MAELEQTDEVIFRLIGVRPFIVRAPGGTAGMFSADFYPALTEAGYVEHDWNVSSEDATPKRPDAAQQIRFVDQMTNGKIQHWFLCIAAAARNRRLKHCRGS